MKQCKNKLLLKKLTIKFCLLFLFFPFFNINTSHAQYNYTDNFNTSSSSLSSPRINNNSTSTAISNASTTEKIKYIMIKNSCKYNFTGICVKIREEPNTKSKIIIKARAGMVLRIESTVTNELGEIWYKIKFTEKLTYSERVANVKGYYVRSDLVEPLKGVEAIVYHENDVINDNKRIIVDISEQTLYAYENNKILYQMKVSTGLSDTPTTADEYYITYKTPSRYMQGPNKENLDKENQKLISKSTSTNNNNSLTSTSTNTKNVKLYTATSTDVKGYYDLPGVPYVMYFSEDGSAIHGAYWHNNFGRHHSHGCVNLSVPDSEKLYGWAESGTSVIIRQ